MPEDVIENEVEEEIDEFGPSGSDDFHQQNGDPNNVVKEDQEKEKEKPETKDVVSREDFKVFAETLGEKLAPKPVQEKEKELTPEELDAQLQVWKPSEDLYDRLGDSETRQAAFVELRDGIMRQALTAAQHMIAAEVGKVRGEFEPVQNFAQQQRATEMRKNFMDQYPALDKYQKLMPLVTASLERRGYKPNSVEDGFNTLADEAAKVIKDQFDPNFDLSAKAKPKDQTSENGRPQMATSGGRGAQGGASSGKTGDSKSPDDGLWD
jgi:hypothetical protein